MFDFNDDERDQLFFNNVNRDLNLDQSDNDNDDDKSCEPVEKTEEEKKAEGVIYRGYTKEFPTFGIDKYKSGSYPNAEHSDRGVMPECVLSHIHQTKGTCGTEVLTFEAEWAGRRICCGVLEFCPGESAYLPTWILNELGCTGGGARLTYRWVKLEPAQYLRIQPLSESFWKLKDVCLFMEEALRSYTTLNKGTTFTAPDPTNTFGAPMHFKVLDTQPERAVQVVNTDPIVDFDNSLCPKSGNTKVNVSTNRTLKEGHMLYEVNNNGKGVILKKDECTICDLCGKSIPNGNLRIHKLRCKRVALTPPEEKQPETVACKYCGMDVARDNCGKHEEECGKRTVTCELCGKLVRRVDMNLHIELGCVYTHSLFSDIKIYFCNTCGKVFNCKAQLSAHNKECGKCGADMRADESVYVCPVCQMIYMNELEYLEHMSQCLEAKEEEEEDDGKKKCGDNENTRYSVLAERKYVCRICGKKFHKQDKLKGHMHKAHR